MRLLVFDTESSTGCIGDGSLCSFGYVLTDGFTILEQEDIVMNPLAPFRSSIIGKNCKVGLAYDKEYFYAQPKFKAFYERISSLFSRADVAVGFAIDNDVKYLNDACRKFHLPLIPYKFFDVKQLLMLYNDENKAKGLGAIAETIDVSFTAHRSDEDARATLLVLEDLCKKHHAGLEGLLKETELVFGENSEKGYVLPESLAELYGRNGFSRTPKQTKVLFNQAMSLARPSMKRDGIFRKKVFSFSQSLKTKDPAFSAGLLKALFSCGGRFSLSVGGANGFVYDAADETERAVAESLKKRSRHFTVLSLEEFTEAVGGITPIPFDYAKTMVRDEIETRIKRAEEHRKKQQLKREAFREKGRNAAKFTKDETDTEKERV